MGSPKPLPELVAPSLVDSSAGQSPPRLEQGVGQGQPAVSVSTAAPNLGAASPLVPSAPPGLHPPKGMPSHGSVLHSSGTCRPCGFFWKASGCQNGLECLHCHLCPDGAAKLCKKAKGAKIREERALAKQASLHARWFT